MRYASMISLVAFHFFHKLQRQLSSKTISKWNLAVITALNCSGISGGTATLSCERKKKHEKVTFSVVGNSLDPMPLSVVSKTLRKVFTNTDLQPGQSQNVHLSTISAGNSHHREEGGREVWTFWLLTSKTLNLSITRK